MRHSAKPSTSMFGRPNVSAAHRSSKPGAKAEVNSSATKSSPRTGASSADGVKRTAVKREMNRGTSVDQPPKEEPEEHTLVIEPKPVTQEVMEIEDEQPHPPVRLPFSEPQCMYQKTAVREEDMQAVGRMQTSIKLPGTALLEPANELVFVQLPSILPKTGDWIGPNNDSINVDDNRPIEAGMKDKISGEPDFSANLKSMPPGHIGKLLVHKSGRVSLQIGEVTYKVSSGIDCAFAQQVLAVDLDSSTCHFVGSVKERLVCSLDVNTLV
eukprot:TRINITY_DN6615_c0_g1_i2.p1 TRINITY_DN6615_c0_g1~~TRINITY_DN6615_c0_g1_i2.p1  ORF type:complete len:269 (-),score=63.48 TRINITY_DN6615_c0_g1_i2:451-1257(-)